ncbi:MAG TPA: helix-turn-helix domain-containing protein [Candidatus Marinimicrobia bacterium]|nr:helix-turn-helix domain-containing protein [Candidatus Neomarinimicrobiota bacterium]MDP7217474.1 helix-turn-helix domain-containing protein [Candidatus Neomarinimicrobiota bacterium]HJL75539.1 helix-turn-helix domain-containing protein [Candidatus Neomarinimicrobiota bacterium]HJM70022.1 helix-turn-helix domain-containing protein [Candidatus Neomarinimicrobiota bacterium]
MANIEKEISTLLERFGFSANAAKAYLSLVNSNPATGYEVSKYSGIPRSAIYGTLTNMEKMGIVSAEGGTPKKYIPLSPSSLIEHLQNLHENQIEDLKLALDKMEMDEEAFDFWHIHGYDNLIFKMREAVNSASTLVIINAWNNEVEKLKKELKTAKARDVDIVIFSFSRIKKPIGTTISYDLDEEDLNEIWKPKVVLVADNKLTIMGSASKQNGRAIWASNPAITKIASDYIILDITLAGQRLGIDINPIVKNIMQKDEFDLDRLINQAKSDI